MADSVAAPSGGDGTGAWEAAAQPAASAQPAAPAQPAAAAPPPSPAQPGVQPSESAPSSATLPKQPTPDAPVATPPVVLKPNKPGGLAGIMDGMLNVLTGTTKPETATGSDGQTYVKQQTLTRGEQWMRIGEEALHGAGAGWAAGRGRNPGAALAAGVQQGDIAAQQRQQQQNDAQGSADKQNAQARQAKLDQFNFVKLQQENAARAFDLKTAAVKGTRDDIDFAQKQDALYKSEGYADMGVATDPGHLADTQKDNPDFWKDVYAGKIVQNKEYDDEGNVTGVHLWHTANNDLSQLAPKGAPLTTWQAPANPNDPNDKGKFVQTPTSGDYTKGALQAYAAKAESDRDAYVLKQANLAHTAAETAAGNATASEAPSVIGKNKAEAAQAYGAASKDNAEAEKDKQTVNDAPLVDEIGTGKMVPERLTYLLARNPGLLEEVAAKYPGFDASKAEQYPATYKDFTSGKVSVALNSGATALEHLQKLAALNTVASHISGTSAYNAYHNQLDTLAPELARFYGDTTVPAIAALKSTLGATMPGNRQAAIQTQVQSMGKKFDNFEQTWRNAAPSAAYEAPMPGVSKEAMEARAQFDPAYRERAVQTQQPAPAAASMAGAVQPGEHVSAGPNGQVVYRGGHWVNPQTGQAVQ
jgi:hypothetical protein